MRNLSVMALLAGHPFKPTRMGLWNTPVDTFLIRIMGRSPEATKVFRDLMWVGPAGNSFGFTVGDITVLEMARFRGVPSNVLTNINLALGTLHKRLHLGMSDNEVRAFLLGTK